jgi:purine-nucleoside/S-methyl-5'-thioadenosine phosphorylase / adenosine deaminase
VIHRELGGATAYFTDRHGGMSKGPFTSCNLAVHVGDDIDAVAANRAAVASAIGASERTWVQPHHVHGTTIVALTEAGSARAAGPDRDADGTATARSDSLLVAIGADCAPVAIANDTAWAAVHAGWRGATDGVVQAGVAAVRALGRGPVRVVVGPCICAVHYEFGAKDLDGLAARLGPSVRARTETGAPAFDLRGAIRLGCEQAGVDHVEVLDVCTFTSPDHYSYRRDRTTGRHGVVVTAR